MMKKHFNLMAFALLAVFSLAFISCSKDNDNGEINFKQDYDILQINGEKYACYGYRCFITYSSDWDLSTHSGTIRLPCGKLSDAKKGEYDYDFWYSIYLEGNQDLKKGSKLENFSPVFEGDYDMGDYISGSATITDKKDDVYITVRFDSFKFSDGSQSYTLDGTVQLDLDED